MTGLDEDAGDGFTHRQNLLGKVMLAFAAGCLLGAIVVGVARGLGVWP